MGLNEIIAFFERRGKDVAQMPGTFWAGVFIAVALGFSGGLYWRAQEVTNAQGMIALDEVRIAALEKDKADNAKLVEDATNAFATYSADQVGKFKQSLETHPSHVASIDFYDTLSPDKSGGPLVKLLQESGWSTTYTPAYSTTFTPSTGTTILAPRDQTSFGWTKDALDAAAIPYVVKTEAGDAIPTLWVATGGADSSRGTSSQLMN